MIKRHILEKDSQVLVLCPICYTPLQELDREEECCNHCVNPVKYGVLYDFECDDFLLKMKI